MDILQKECGEIKKYKNKKRDLAAWGVGIAVGILIALVLCFGSVLKGEADHEIGKQLVTDQNCRAMTSDQLRNTAKEDCMRAAVYANGHWLRQYFTYAKYETEDYFDDWAILNPKLWFYTIFVGGFAWFAKWMLQFSFGMVFGNVFRKTVGLVV